LSPQAILLTNSFSNSSSVIRDLQKSLLYRPAQAGLAIPIRHDERTRFVEVLDKEPPQRVVEGRVSCPLQQNLPAEKADIGFNGFQRHP